MPLTLELVPPVPHIGVAYRYEDRAWRELDIYDERYVGLPHYEIFYREYPVIKETPHGFWLHDNGRRRFVLNNSRKRFACRTKAEALASFIARKQVQVRIVKSQLARAEAALALAKEQQERGDQL